MHRWNMNKNGFWIPFKGKKDCETFYANWKKNQMRYKSKENVSKRMSQIEKWKWNRLLGNKNLEVNISIWR